jgi:hypothetical protein
MARKLPTPITLLSVKHSILLPTVEASNTNGAKEGHRALIAGCANPIRRGFDKPHSELRIIGKGVKYSWQSLRDRVGGGLMPTVLRIEPYRFFFVSLDRDEPPHVHVQRENRAAKFWLDPVALARTGGYSRAELNQIAALVLEYRPVILERWHEHFGR